ncbi:flavin-containing monooxygenase [Sulfitobacter dubius]|uniref:Trimethylamine monooxygenase n=1 Tax=Sulfitobacter dubius TaxID=218673 RepID=A0ABY3ZQP5_9RHOB|nr:NAD(P)/FAD-dependent oxidoreductase [Sulfitobacter dubius]UOA16945.1 putative monooxygenase [Sulfitobacter dubius]
MEKVAIVGAGPGGIVAARFLQSQGFDPVLFEAHDRPGGQWCHDNPASGVWPMMRTNTARMVTRFSDLDYPAGVAMFPRNQDVGDYLDSYAELFGLNAKIRTGTRLKALEQMRGGWRLTIESGGETREETFPRVVIATGAYNRPGIPNEPGLDGFSGDLGAIHAFDYDTPDAYRGKRVLIAGGNISSLEIASDLAMLGAAHVATAMRRQRYVMPKLIAGTPVESYVFTRAAALFQETASSEEWAEQTKAFVLQYGGDPVWYGAPAADPDVRRAGTTGSQNFLNLVAEDRIRCHPWIASIEDRTVRFTDGSEDEFDGIIFGTGYRMNLPFLSQALCETLELTDKSITLANHTFHPDAPGLAFMGLWAQIGPYLPALELQARYLAYSWGSVVPAAEDATLRDACARARSERGKDRYRHIQTLRFARLAGCDPEGAVDAPTAAMLAANAVTALSFRLTGPDALPDAAAQLRAETLRYGRKDQNFA